MIMAPEIETCFIFAPFRVAARAGLMRWTTITVSATILAMFAIGAACAGGDGAVYALGGDAGAGSAPDGAPADATTVDSPTGAASIYVSPTGDDTASGTSATSPVKTIQTAIGLAANCAGAPCVVLAAAGSYAQPLQLADGVSIYGQYASDFSARISNQRRRHHVHDQPYRDRGRPHEDDDDRRRARFKAHRSPPPTAARARRSGSGTP